MALSKLSFLHNTFNQMVAIGDHAISSDSMLSIEGFEEYSLLIKGFPQPTISVGEPIEVPLPMGATKWQKSQAVINQQGGLTLTETIAGHGAILQRELLKAGGNFRAKVYEGTRTSYVRYYQLEHCSLQLDPAERDWESKTQVLQMTGNLSYHYFGKVFDADGNPEDAFVPSSI